MSTFPSAAFPTVLRSAEHAWDQLLTVLEQGEPLSTVLNIHDGVGRAFFNSNVDRASGRYSTYQKWLRKVRASEEGELFHEPRAKEFPYRGREQRPDEERTASRLPGNLESLPRGYEDILPGGFRKLEWRYRGVDQYKRVTPRADPEGYQPTAASGNLYFEELDRQNELFGAGPSGTTGTLLAAAFAFGGFDPDTNMERVREYLFAIIGYLVGGGMHTLNESLIVLKLLDLEYHIGSLRGRETMFNGEGQKLVRVLEQYPLLPHTFLNSREFNAWRDAFYDTVILGGMHWTYTAGDNW